MTLAATTVDAQEGVRFRVTEHARNAGGSPVAGSPVASQRFEVDPSSIGDGVTRHSLLGARFRGAAGFSLGFRPAGEVFGLVIGSDHRTLGWSPEPSVGHYHVYRDSIGALSQLGYGTCLASDVETTTHDDPESPADGDGYFYLVTASDRLHREGTKGASSAGIPRANPAPCP
jgi:hypothetical protein